MEANLITNLFVLEDSKNKMLLYTWAGWIHELTLCKLNASFCHAIQHLVNPRDPRAKKHAIKWKILQHSKSLPFTVTLDTSTQFSQVWINSIVKENKAFLSKA